MWSPSHLFPVRGAEGVKPLKRASLSFRGLIPSKGHGELKEFLTLAGEDQEPLSVVGKALDASDKIKAYKNISILLISEMLFAFICRQSIHYDICPMAFQFSFEETRSLDDTSEQMLSKVGQELNLSVIIQICCLVPLFLAHLLSRS